MRRTPSRRLDMSVGVSLNDGCQLAHSDELQPQINAAVENGNRLVTCRLRHTLYVPQDLCMVGRYTTTMGFSFEPQMEGVHAGESSLQLTALDGGAKLYEKRDLPIHVYHVHKVVMAASYLRENAYRSSYLLPKCSSRRLRGSR